MNPVPEETAKSTVALAGQRWYKTGGKGCLDWDSFLTIVNYYSRFAKLGGKMISLTQVEEQVWQILAEPELGLAGMLESSVRNSKNSGELNACSFI